MKPWQNDPFFQYPQTVVSTSEGDVELPILYFDNSNLMALFRVDYDKAQVAPHDLQAIRFAGGKALAVVAFYEYRATSIADYHEVGVAVAVVPKGAEMPSFPLLSLFKHLDKNRAGFYILDLPVPTAAACAAGRDTWGYPKFVTPIGFSLHGSRFEGTVADPDSGGESAEGRRADRLWRSRTFAGSDPVFATQRQNAAHIVNTRGGGKMSLPGSIRLAVSDSKHPMAQRLIGLGLKSARPGEGNRTPHPTH